MSRPRFFKEDKMYLLDKEMKIRGVKLSSRLVMPPMAVSLARDGYITQANIDYYSNRTAGGHIGLVITEHCYVRADGQSDLGQISVSRDEDITGLSELAAAVHENGSKVLAQINHSGFTAQQAVTGTPPLCVSSEGFERMYGMSFPMHEIGEAEIPALVDAYAKAAGRVKKAGFDGVEIHSAHGFLLNQFFSPLSNCRTDSYGGTLENRIRIHLQIIDAIKKIAGDDFIIALRLGASDYEDGGTVLEDSIRAAEAFEEAGIDLLDISGGFCGFTIPGKNGPGYFGELSKPIREKVNIPVILTGGIRTAEQADTLLREGYADLTGVGREILMDPEWAAKNMG
jgi:NADPH2 dehydrogenase